MSETPQLPHGHLAPTKKNKLNDKNATHFLVGQVMKETKGKADPKLTNKLINEKLESKKKQINP